METEKEKWFVIDATVTMKVVATSIVDAQKRIKSGEGQVVSFRAPHPNLWLRDSVVFTCNRCNGCRCVLGMSNIELPIEPPETCPWGRDILPDGPYSGCYE